MTKLVHFDADTGAFLGFYVEAIHSDIPEPNVPISHENWQAYIDGIANFRVDTVELTIKPYTPAPPSRLDRRKAALARVDAEHADYLVTLTGGATVAERDTWKIKEEAARAFEAGTATPIQTAMLTAEAEGAGVSVENLAATIIAKDDAYLLVIGLAAGIRAKGRAAILAATDGSIPDDQIGDRLDEIEAELRANIAAALAQIQSSE